MTLEENIHNTLYTYLFEKEKIDMRMPEMIDIESKWELIANSYLPDGIREFSKYPNASLGWMMYIGMAVATMWDVDWVRYSQLDDIYAYLKNKRGYDFLDEMVREDFLKLTGDAFNEMEDLVVECANIAHRFLLRDDIEAGTVAAFNAYVQALHQLYLMGAATQLYNLGYRMKKME